MKQYTPTTTFCKSLVMPHQNRIFSSIVLGCLFLAISCTWTLAQDILLQDFESGSYNDWAVTGTAFGNKPAEGTLPHQMQVSNYQGKWLVNSFVGGDDSVGTLESPKFEITKPFINFLVGGGGWDETAVTLVIDNEVILEARGNNTLSGGEEKLTWQSWNVTPFQNKMARIRIVDQKRGGWGHILADHFVMSDAPKEARTLEKTILVEGRYLHFPVKTGAPKVWVNLKVGAQRVRRFELELVGDDPSFVTAADVEPWKHEQLTIEIEETFADEAILQGITSNDSLPNADEIFMEPLRPAFHFTSKIGWLNDPNGLVYHNGTWHLFYQHNPFGWNWGNMHWGHATSADLVTWIEQGDKIHPWSDAKGAAFSGSGLIDSSNTSGLGTGDGELLVFPFTDTELGESLAYSNNGGQTLRIFEGNPVVRHQGRDPKVIWHKPTKKWVMAVYTEFEGKQWIAFYNSNNLIDWKLESRIEGFFECPDLFELPVIGASGQSSWVLYAADGRYVLGEFDGREFKPQHDGKYQVWYGDFYAAQTYSDVPENRRVQIGWGRGTQFPDHRFNQQMVVPVDLTLKQTPAGTRMFAYPVEEHEAYCKTVQQIESLALNHESRQLAKFAAPWDCDLTFDIEEDSIVRVDVGGAVIEIDRVDKKVRLAEIEADYPQISGSVELRVLVDRGSIELFVDGGSLAFSKSWLYGRDSVELITTCPQGTARLVEGSLRSIQVDRR